MKKIIFLIILIATCFSCGKNDDPEVPTKPTIRHKLSLSKLETFYGTGINAFRDPVSFKVDSLNRISTISYSGIKHTMSYPDSSLIIFRNVDGTTGDVMDISYIHIESNKVKKICGYCFNQNDKMRAMSTDSILFTYNSNNNLMRIDHLKRFINSTTYWLANSYEYTYESGNITKFIRIQYTFKTILNYSYDNQTNINNYGEYAPDMPFMFDYYYYPLIYDKLGKRNVNNIVKVTYTYPNAPSDIRNFDYINYERVLDSNGLLSAIKMTGQRALDDLTSSTTYNDVKVSFTYQ